MRALWLALLLSGCGELSLEGAATLQRRCPAVPISAGSNPVVSTLECVADIRLQATGMMPGIVTWKADGVGKPCSNCGERRTLRGGAVAPDGTRVNLDLCPSGNCRDRVRRLDITGPDGKPYRYSPEADRRQLVGDLIEAASDRTRSSR